MKTPILNKYKGLYLAICNWNKAKSWKTFCVLREEYRKNSEVCQLRQLWYIVKDTITGKYKKIEKECYLPLDKS